MEEHLGLAFCLVCYSFNELNFQDIYQIWLDILWKRPRLSHTVMFISVTYLHIYTIRWAKRHRNDELNNSRYCKWCKYRQLLALRGCPTTASRRLFNRVKTQSTRWIFHFIIGKCFFFTWEWNFQGTHINNNLFEKKTIEDEIGFNKMKNVI